MHGSDWIKGALRIEELYDSAKRSYMMHVVMRIVGLLETYVTHFCWPMFCNCSGALRRLMQECKVAKVIELFELYEEELTGGRAPQSILLFWSHDSCGWIWTPLIKLSCQSFWSIVTLSSSCRKKLSALETKFTTMSIMFCLDLLLRPWEASNTFTITERERRREEVRVRERERERVIRERETKKEKERERESGKERKKILHELTVSMLFDTLDFWI